MASNLEFLAAFGFLQVKEGDRAISMHSISEIALLPDGEAAVTTINGTNYTLPADQFNRYREHCESLLAQFANANQQPSRLVLPDRRPH